MTQRQIDTSKLTSHSHSHLHHMTGARADDDLDGLPPRAQVTLPAELDDPTVRARREAIGPDDFTRFEGYLAEILAGLGMNLDTPGTLDTPRRLMRALFDATEGYDGDPNLVAVFPTECYGGSSCELSQVVEGPIPFTAVRAPRPSLRRAGLRRLYRPREHHRDKQADPAGQNRHEAIRRPGADDPPDRGDARTADGSTRRGRVHGGASPLHPDERRTRSAANYQDHGLHRRLRRQLIVALGVLRSGGAPARSPRVR